MRTSWNSSSPKRKAKRASRDFPVVCVGGSAGGLDAYIRLLRNLPANMGVAIVVVNHLRTVATLLHEILPQYTTMPVELITDRLVIEPNHVFIIPAQHDLHVLAGEFRLKPISKPRGWPDVITVFLRSLTEHWMASLSLLSSLAMMAMGQPPCAASRRWGHDHRAEARHRRQPDMPESAIASGCVDLCSRLRTSPKQLCDLRTQLTNRLCGVWRSRRHRVILEITRRSRSIDPTSRSTYGFCQGDRGDGARTRARRSSFAMAASSVALGTHRNRAVRIPLDPHRPGPAADLAILHSTDSPGSKSAGSISTPPGSPQNGHSTWSQIFPFRAVVRRRRPGRRRG